MCTRQGTLELAESAMARQRPLETPKTLEMMLGHLHQRMVNTQQWHWLKDHASAEAPRPLLQPVQWLPKCKCSLI